MKNKKAILMYLLVTVFGISGTMYGGVGQMDSVYGNQGNNTSYVNPNGAVVATGYYNNYNSWATNSPGIAAIPIGTILENPPSDAVPLMVKGSRYYYESGVNTYFAQVYAEGAIVYQVVPPPIGAVVSEIPANCNQQYFNGRQYLRCGNTYYEQVAGGYQVVALN